MSDHAQSLFADRWAVRSATFLLISRCIVITRFSPEHRNKWVYTSKITKLSVQATESASLPMSVSEPVKPSSQPLAEE